MFGRSKTKRKFTTFAAGARETCLAARRSLASCLVFAFCSLSTQVAFAQGGQSVNVVTSINVLSQPLSWLFEDQIDDGLLQIEPLMSVGVDPHLYVPTRADLRRLIAADVLVFMGLGLEAQFDDVLTRLVGQVDQVKLEDFLPRQPLIAAVCPDEAGDFASNCYADPHVWMAPMLFGQALAPAAAQIAERLDLPMDEVAQLDARLRSYMRLLDQSLEALLTQAQVDKPMVTAHDALAYFEARFGIETLGVAGISTDIEASVSRVQELADKLVDDGVPAVFLESSVPARGVQSVIEAAGRAGQTVRIEGPLYTDSVGRRGSSAASYVGMQLSNALAIACALGSDPMAQLCEQDRELALVSLVEDFEQQLEAFQ